jgi:hypothetical protein
MSAPILLMPSNDNGARTLLPVAGKLGAEALFVTFDEVRGEGARRILGNGTAKLGGEPFATPRTRLGPLGTRARDFYQRARALFRSKRPALAVLTNDLGWPENLLISAAMAEGVPTALVQDGILDLDARGPSALQRRWWRTWRCAGLPAGPMQAAYGANGTTWHCVMGTDDAARLARLGVPPEAVRVTGQPRFDALMYPGNAPPRPEAACFVVIGFCASAAYGFMTEDEYSRQHRLIAEALLALPGVHVAVKPHPRCDSDGLLAALRACEGDRLRVHPASDDLTPLLRAADIFVTDISSAGVEALLLGKPVVSMPLFFPRPVRLCYREHGLALVADSAHALAAIVGGWQQDADSARAGLDRFAAARNAVCAHAGEAAEHVAAALAEFAGRDRR